MAGDSERRPFGDDRVVALTTKFLEGAWVVVLVIPILMWLFSHTEVASHLPGKFVGRSFRGV